VHDTVLGVAAATDPAAGNTSIRGRADNAATGAATNRRVDRCMVSDRNDLGGGAAVS
jgi:hypothetical protein